MSWSSHPTRGLQQANNVPNRVFYWFGARYSNSLLFQACLMIVVQIVLLTVALDNRAPVGARYGLEHVPFNSYSAGGSLPFLLSGRRPFDFWRWNNARPWVELIFVSVASKI